MQDLGSRFGALWDAQGVGIAVLLLLGFRGVWGLGGSVSGFGVCGLVVWSFLPDGSRPNLGPIVIPQGLSPTLKRITRGISVSAVSYLFRIHGPHTSLHIPAADLPFLAD